MDNTFDSLFYGRGELIAGVDESGVSDIAGPLVAACVILPKISVDRDDLRIFEVNDSKAIPEKYRKTHAQTVWETAIAIGIGEATPQEIDFLGKRKATILAMVKAVASCQSQSGELVVPDLVLVDGEFEIPVPIPQESIKYGDTKSLCIASSSIIAKVYRDDIMRKLHSSYPHYGWMNNKGYPCENQFKGLDQNGAVLGVHRTKSWPFVPNQEKKEGEEKWYWRRTLWKTKTLEMLVQEASVAMRLNT